MAVLIVGMVAAALLTRTGLMAFAWTAFAAITVIRWLMIIGLIVGITCSPQFYHEFGWTPLSIVAGDDIYKNVKHK